MNEEISVWKILKYKSSRKKENVVVFLKRIEKLGLNGNIRNVWEKGHWQIQPSLYSINVIIIQDVLLLHVHKHCHGFYRKCKKKTPWTSHQNKKYNNHILELVSMQNTCTNSNTLKPCLGKNTLEQCLTQKMP